MLRLSSDLTLKRASTSPPGFMKLMEKLLLREQLLRKNGNNCSPSTKANTLKKQRIFQEDLMEDSPRAGRSICQRRAYRFCFEPNVVVVVLTRGLSDINLLTLPLPLGNFLRLFSLNYTLLFRSLLVALPI